MGREYGGFFGASLPSLPNYELGLVKRKKKLLMATIVASITLNIMLLDPIYTHVPRGFWFFSLKSTFQQSPYTRFHKPLILQDAQNTGQIKEPMSRTRP